MRKKRTIKLEPASMSSRRKQSKPRALKREVSEDEKQQPLQGDALGCDPENGDVVMEKSTSHDEATPGELPDDPSYESPAATELMADGPDTALEMGATCDGADKAGDTAEEDEDDDDGEDAEDENDDEEEEIYKCDVCSETFNSITDFMDHRNKDCKSDDCLINGDVEGDAQYRLEHKGLVSAGDSSLPYPCQYCEKSFSRLRFLKLHEQSHRDKLRFECTYCARLFKHKRSLDRHVKLHTGFKKYHCPYCEAAYARSDHLKTHIQTHIKGTVKKQGPTSLHMCPTCNRGFLTNRALVIHQNTCGKASLDEDLALKCDQCSVYFLTSEQLEEHMAHHASSSNMVVKFADEEMKSKRPNELEIQDSNNPTMKAEPSSSSLTNSQSATPETSLNCPHCSWTDFPSAESLTIHIQQVHIKSPSAPQSYVCHYCGKDYPSLYNLTEHISALHENEAKNIQSGDESRNFICGYCTMKFSSMQELHEHVKSVHSMSGLISYREDGKLVCPYCNAAFPSEVALMDHFRNVHNSFDNAKDRSKLQCPHCTKTYPNERYLQEHMKRSHCKPLDKMKYPCPYCIKQNLFDSIEQLQLHIEVFHKSSHAPVYLNSESGSNSTSGSILKDQLSGGRTDGKPKPDKLPAAPISIPTFKVSKDAKEVKMVKKEPATSPVPAPVAISVSPPEDQECQSQCSDGSITEDVKMSCPTCHNEFPNKEQLIVHVLTHFKAVSKEYVCKDCGKAFKKPDELQKHLFEIHAHHLFKCSLCKEVFDSKVTIQVHFAVNHSNEHKIFSCTKCGLVYNTEAELLVHVKAEHLKIVQPFKCIFCSQSFASDVEFQCHLTTHSNQFRCPFCNAPYQSQEALDIHLQAAHDHVGGSSTLEPADTAEETHGRASVDSAKKSSVTSESSMKSPKPRDDSAPDEVAGCFTCQICDIMFPLKSLLEKHREQEHNIKARSATIKMEMTQSINIADHVKGKFSCQICPEKFKSKFEMMKHLNSHSMQEKQTFAQIARAKSPAISPRSASPQQPCVCQVCHQALRSEAEFLDHTQRHNVDLSLGSERIRCLVCLQELTSLVELQLHARHHTQISSSLSGQELYPCYLCGKAFASRADVVPKLDTDGRPCFSCMRCVKTTLEAQFHGATKQGQTVQPINQLNVQYSRSKVEPNPDIIVAVHRCMLCRVKFESQEELALHMQVHTQTTPSREANSSGVGSSTGKTYQCIKCQKTFATEAEIQLHVTSHVLAEGVLHECKLCRQVFDSPAKLQCHLIEHSFPDKEYRCPICRALFSCANDIQAHAIEHGMDSRHHKCMNCSQSFFFPAELMNHAKSHPQCHQESKFNCGECKQSFASLFSLSNHMKLHLNKPTVKCSMCPEVFQSVLDMQHHYFRVHTETDVVEKEKTYDCTKCGKSFPSITTLQGHMRIHHEGKKYTCGECNKVFALARNLTIHMRSHSGDKPYQCPICDKRFARKENRKVHMQSHSGVRPFMCPHCGKMFSRKFHVQVHMRTHSKSRTSSTHQCEICKDNFTLAKNLRRHLKKVHKIQSSLLPTIVSDNLDEDEEESIMEESLDADGSGTVDQEVSSSQDVAMVSVEHSD